MRKTFWQRWCALVAPRARPSDRQASVLALSALRQSAPIWPHLSTSTGSINERLLLSVLRLLRRSG